MKALQLIALAALALMFFPPARNAMIEALAAHNSRVATADPAAINLPPARFSPSLSVPAASREADDASADRAMPAPILPPSRLATARKELCVELVNYYHHTHGDHEDLWVNGHPSYDIPYPETWSIIDRPDMALSQARNLREEINKLLKN